MGEDVAVGMAAPEDSPPRFSGGIVGRRIEDPKGKRSSACHDTPLNADISILAPPDILPYANWTFLPRCSYGGTQKAGFAVETASARMKDSVFELLRAKFPAATDSLVGKTNGTEV